MDPRLSLMPLNGLRAFEAAARHLSFSHAAEELGVTPAAVSHQIRGLEDKLGHRLFVRRTRAVELTEAGLRLLPGRFMVIEQAMGTPHGRGADAARVLAAFVEEMKASGFVAQALQRHGIQGAAVAPGAAA